MSWLEILAVIAIIGFVIYQQIAGQQVQAKRLVVLPAVLTVGAVGSVLTGLIAPRAMLAGLPFAAEQDGRTFLPRTSAGAGRDRSARY